MVFALPLGRRPLDNQDEARYSLLAREAVERGHWILPRVRDEVYLNKPPLYFWTVAAFALPWGVVTDANAPLASVASALAGLLAVFAVACLLWGARAGLAAALVLATSPFYFFMAHQVLTDMMLTAWMTWALYFYLAAGRAHAPRWPLAGFYLCAAGGLASKGPAALMVLAAAAAASLAADGWGGLRRLRLPLGLGLIALTALPWLLPYLFQRERSYGRAVVMTDYLGWYFKSAVGSRVQAVAAHLARLLPWGVFVFPAAWWWTRERSGDRKRLLVWAATLIVLLSLSGEQRARYFLPLWPIFALLVDGGHRALPHINDRGGGLPPAEPRLGPRCRLPARGAVGALARGRVPGRRGGARSLAARPRRRWARGDRLDRRRARGRARRHGPRLSGAFRPGQ